MVPILHMMVPTLHMMIPTITLFGILNFYLLFKFNIYKKNTSHWIVPISHMMVFILHLMVPIEWIPYPQKECGYCRMTLNPSYLSIHKPITENVNNFTFLLSFILILNEI